MAELVGTLSFMLGRPVIDQTGFTGTFDAHLTFTPNESLAGIPGMAPSATDPAGTPIFAAIREQLGLTLEPVPRPVDILVIESVEKATEN